MPPSAKVAGVLGGVEFAEPKADLRGRPTCVVNLAKIGAVPSPPEDKTSSQPTWRKGKDAVDGKI
jgi:hypothetical protein